jgi:hypothetical protein
MAVHTSLGSTEQASVHAGEQISPYVNIHKNIPQVPSLPVHAYPKAHNGYLPILSVLIGPQHTPQIPLISQGRPKVTPAHTNAPQVPFVSQNASEVPFVHGTLYKNIAQVQYIPQNTHQEHFEPKNAHSNVPRISSTFCNTQVPSVPKNAHENSLQIPLSANAPEFPSMTENALQTPFMPVELQTIPTPVNHITQVLTVPLNPLKEIPEKEIM